MRYVKKNKDNLTLNTDSFRFYERLELEQMTLKKLRALAKQSKINLRKKSDIINIMFSLFLQLKNSNSDIEILPMTFNIITDSNNNINISLWFRGKDHSFSR